MTVDQATPPPGDTSEQLPEHILRLIVPRPYVSTACETGQACASAVVRWPERKERLKLWEQHLHGRCRRNNKFTGKLCACPCHADGVDA